MSQRKWLAVLNTGLQCVSVLWVNPRQATFTDIILHIFTTFFLHFPRPLVPGVAKSVTKMDKRHVMQYIPRPSVRRIGVISSVPSFWSSEVEGAPSRSWVPQIMEWSLWWSCCRSGACCLHVSLLWSIAEWTQALCTLLCTLGERCLVMRTGTRVSFTTPRSRNI